MVGRPAARTWRATGGGRSDPWPVRSAGGAWRRRRRQPGDPGGVVVVETRVPGAQRRLGRRHELGDGGAGHAPPGPRPERAVDLHRHGAREVAEVDRCAFAFDGLDVLRRAEGGGRGPAMRGAVARPGHAAGRERPAAREVAEQRGDRRDALRDRAPAGGRQAEQDQAAVEGESRRRRRDEQCGQACRDGPTTASTLGDRGRGGYIRKGGQRSLLIPPRSLGTACQAWGDGINVGRDTA